VNRRKRRGPNRTTRELERIRKELELANAERRRKQRQRDAEDEYARKGGIAP
jgi:hypothetical protein